MHVRSQAPEHDSLDNVVERNRVARVGLATKDLGGISVIAYGMAPPTRTALRENCVADVLGVFSAVAGAAGELVSPFMTWGIYLDNEASGYAVSRNVVARNERGCVFVHNGRENGVENNVCLNASIASGDGGQLDLAGSPSYATANNTFARNVVAWAGAPKLWSAEGGFDEIYLPPAGVRDNTYWRFDDAGARAGSEPLLTPLGNWSAWTSARYDAGSAIEDPRFVDAANGNVCLRDDSPALARGFAPLPEGLCARCARKFP